MVAAVLVLGAILARGFAENGFRLGSQLAWRYASFVFFAALVAGPVCRIAAHFLPAFTPPESLSRKLVWGFCASYGVYLLSVFLPNVIQLSGRRHPDDRCSAARVALVMALTAAPLERLGGKPDPVRQGPPRAAGHRGDLFLAVLLPDGAGAHFRAAPAGCLLRHQPRA